MPAPGESKECAAVVSEDQRLDLAEAATPRISYGVLKLPPMPARTNLWEFLNCLSRYVSIGDESLPVELVDRFRRMLDDPSDPAPGNAEPSTFPLSSLFSHTASITFIVKWISVLSDARRPPFSFGRGFTHSCWPRVPPFLVRGRMQEGSGQIWPLKSVITGIQYDFSRV